MDVVVTPAVQLLAANLAAGRSRAASATTTTTTTTRPALVPPASHLALLNTLTIHPLHTTRADKPESLEVSARALAYLRDVLHVVGPFNADFKTAFMFRPPARSGGLGGRSGHFRSNTNADNSDVSDGEAEGGEDRLSSVLANSASVWQRGQDFWSVVGWAFNCCTLYPKRWKHWLTWLEFMIEVLQADWDERERRDAENHEARGGAPQDPPPATLRKQSIMCMYMRPENGRQLSFKHMLRAILADGGSVTSSSFREVFDKEQRGPKKENKKRKRETLDLDNDKYGDYFDDDPMSSGTSEPPTPQKPRDTRKVSFGTSQAGFAESIPLRLRLFKLLSLAVFTLDNAEIFSLYDLTSSLLVLPLHSFFLVTSQRPGDLVPDAHITLTKLLLERLVPSTRRNPRRVDQQAEDEGRLTSPMLEHCYAAHPANTVALEDNAKLSLVVEKALLLLWQCDALDVTPSFREAVERGVAAREAKARKKRTTGKARNPDGADDVALDMLVDSGERIRALLDTLESFPAEEASES